MIETYFSDTFPHMHIQYEDAKNNTTLREIEPLGVCRVTLDQIALIAWCHLRQAKRLFILDKIWELSALHSHDKIDVLSLIKAPLARHDLYKMIRSESCPTAKPLSYSALDILDNLSTKIGFDVTEMMVWWSKDTLRTDVNSQISDHIRTLTGHQAILALSHVKKAGEALYNRHGINLTQGTICVWNSHNPCAYIAPLPDIALDTSILIPQDTL
jgi:hypothetical protein